MMCDRPPETFSFFIKNDGGEDVEQLLSTILQRAANRSNVNISSINIITNPGSVFVSGNPKMDSTETTLIDGVEMMNEKTEIHANRSVVNYKSHLHNVHTLVEASVTEDVADHDKEVYRAIRDFSAKLEEIGEENAEELELLSQRLEEVTKLFVKPTEQRKPNLLKMSAKGLLSVAKEVGEIVPGLINKASIITDKIKDCLS